MSTQITEAFVKQFSSSVFHLSQQKGSRLRGSVRRESQKGKTAFYDRIGAVSAQKKTSRHGDTPQLDTPHSRRMVSLSDYEWADLIDDADKVRLLIDPSAQYIKAAMWAMGRAMDDELILAATGTSYSGEEGTTAVTLPASQYVGCVSGGSLSNLNVATLIKIKSKFGTNDVDEEIPLHIAVTQAQIDNLLTETQVTSADYNSVKALVEGKVDTFMGFKFHRLQRLGTISAAAVNTTTQAVTLSTGNGDGKKLCFAWAEDGILLSVGQDMKSRITERADKSYSVQPFASMGIGATRMEEEKVVGIVTNE